MARRQAVQQRADHQQVRIFHQLRMQLALFVVALDRAAEMHATLVLHFAAGAGVKVDVGITWLRHAVLPDSEVLGGSASKCWVTL